MTRLPVLLLLVLLLPAALCLRAQNANPALDQLRRQRGDLQQRIARSEALLQTTSDDTRSQLEALTLLDGQLEERRRYIRALNLELDTLDNELRRQERLAGRLKEELRAKQDRYADAVRYLQRHRATIQEKLLFIFSADGLRQMYRRLRYVREYAGSQRRWGEEIARQREQADRQRADMLRLREAKGALLKDREREMLSLQEKEQEKAALVETLQRKQRELKRELARQRREAEQLNARIDRLINEEIEKARQAALAEERRRRRQQQADAAARHEETAANAENQPVIDRSAQQLTGTFASNRGRLPAPITGPYTVAGRYGRYTVMRGVVLDNKGIDLQGQPGARARSVFDGRVAAVFQLNGLWNILVRHGDYISVYCNLSAALVKPGDAVKARQPVGDVFSDGSDGGRTVLHFQLRREKEKLNPEQWLAL